MGFFDMLRSLAEEQGGPSPSPLAAPSDVPGWDPYGGSTYGVHPADLRLDPLSPGAPDVADQSPASSPILATSPAPASSGGGFWGGLLDYLKSVPIQTGGLRSGRVTLPSYNQATAGKRLLEFGRQQGLNVGEGGSATPEEAEFRVKLAEQRRLTDPMGMDVAQQLLPPQAGEAPEAMLQRAWLAKLPRKDLSTLVAHQVQQYGLPGWGGEQPIDPYAALKDLPSETAAPSGASAPPSSQAAPAPSPTLVQPGAASTTPTPAPLVRIQPQGQAAPSTAAVPASQTAPSTQAAPGMPQPPSVPTGGVTREQVLRHPTVTAAQAAYDASRTLTEKRQNAVALRTALANAPYKIQQEQHQRYGEQSQAYRNQMEAQKFYLEAARAPYGYGTDVDAQIRMDYGNVAHDDPRLQAMATAAEPRAAARLAANKASEAAATKGATMTTEEQVRNQQPLTVALNNDMEKVTDWRSKQTGYPLVREQPDIPYSAARQQGALVTGEDKKQLDALLGSIPVVQELNRMYQRLYGPGGIYEHLTPDERLAMGKTGSRAYAQLNQDYPELETMRTYIEANAELLARAIGGVRGQGTEKDVERAKSMFAQVAEGFGIHMAGAIPYISWNRPDTRAVAISKLNAYNETLDKRTGALLGQPDFQHPGLMPRMTPEQLKRESQKTGGAIGPYRPEVGPQGMTPEQLQAVPRRAPTPTPPGAQLIPQQPQGTAPVDTMRQVQQTSLKQHGLTQPPNPQQQPQAFQSFMNTVREQVRRYFPRMTPQEQQTLTQRIAQKLGGTWP